MGTSPRENLNATVESPRGTKDKLGFNANGSFPASSNSRAGKPPISPRGSPRITKDLNVNTSSEIHSSPKLKKEMPLSPKRSWNASPRMNKQVD